MSEEKTYPQALLGFRVWILQEGLYSMGLGSEPWASTLKEAKCKRGFSHLAPDGDCSCGLYAFYDLEEILSHRRGTLLELGASKIDTPVSEKERLLLEEERDKLAPLGSYLVVGAVAARGQVELHWNGFRAQEMQILSFLLNDLQKEDPWIKGLNLPLFDSFAAFEKDALEKAARLPNHLRAEAPLSAQEMSELSDLYPRVRSEEDYQNLARHFSLPVHELSDLTLHLGLGAPRW